MHTTHLIMLIWPSLRGSGPPTIRVTCMPSASEIPVSMGPANDASLSSALEIISLSFSSIKLCMYVHLARNRVSRRRNFQRGLPFLDRPFTFCSSEFLIFADDRMVLLLENSPCNTVTERGFLFRRAFRKFPPCCEFRLHSTCVKVFGPPLVSLQPSGLAWCNTRQLRKKTRPQIVFGLFAGADLAYSFGTVVKPVAYSLWH